ncbi:choice-of-anchor Q domain-containing protein [Marinicella sp. W31]|uniref:choice-of-anchor Q domain-containing protein n=1 Tax=Marinicella sp. W31 TaxID=3023713 RepID=UPI003757EFAF
MKYYLFLLVLMSVTVEGQTLDCNNTPERSLVGATILGNGSPGSVSTGMIQNALNAGGNIRFNLGATPTTINLTTQLLVTRNTVIDGGGLVTLNAQSNQRIFRIDNPNNLQYTFTVQNITLTGGDTPTESGAAIFKPSGGPWQAVSLEVINTRFNDNHAIQVEQDGGGGAIYAIGMKDIFISDAIFENNSGSNGGAFYSLGSDNIRITNSIFDGNAATGNNGNPGNGGNGGAIGVDGAERSISICRTQIINNTANAFGVGFFSVMYDQQSLTAFSDSTFRNNINPNDFGLGGGAYIQGGPFFIQKSSFIENEARGAGGIFFGPNANGDMINSTVYGNIATNTLGGGFSIDGSAAVNFNHLTIMNNQAPCGVCFAGGISVFSPNQVTLNNSIIANNTGGNAFNAWNILSTVAGGNNLQYPQQRPNGGAETPATASLIWGDPQASPPADNGGFTETLAIASGAPGINQANASNTTAADQRGISRFQGSDIGAYERVTDLIFANSFE